ncbi:hypothetical protein [Sphingopyxis granuli]|uniref:hypothetical protein n=1 Tax=Sphingopyxis granuli TaxID=267128 RepID=UPI00301D3116
MADIELAVAGRNADRDEHADIRSFEALLGLSGLVKAGRITANWLSDGHFARDLQRDEEIAL